MNNAMEGLEFGGGIEIDMFFDHSDYLVKSVELVLEAILCAIELMGGGFPNLSEEEVLVGLVLRI
jgi:hypothetical protein